MINIVPHVLACSHSKVIPWVHQQIQTLFLGRDITREVNPSYSDPSDYQSPMVLPVSWHPTRALEQIRSHPYFVAEKYDGVRYFLFLGQYTHRSYSFMIDRRGSVFPVAVACAADYFQDGGSLFEGELVWNGQTKKQEFYVFDMIAIHGQHMHTIDKGHLFRERTQWIQEIFGDVPYSQHVINQSTHWKEFVEDAMKTRHEWTNKIISLGNHHSLQFFPKMFYPLSSFDPKFMARKDIPNDGYIFTPDYCPIGVVTTPDQPRIWKWKPTVTIDCWLRQSDPIVHLIYKRVREPLRFVRMQNKSIQCRWTDDSNHIVTLQWQVVECVVHYDPLVNELVFRPVRVRHDKSFPNSIKTFQRTLPSILHPTPLEDVFGNFVT
jgi:hypothetical protein